MSDSGLGPQSSSVTASIDIRILEEAAQWLTRLHGDDVTDRDREAWERWRCASPEHALAWERAERILSKLSSVPPRLAMRVLDRSPEVSRRDAIAKGVALLIVVPAVSWAGWRLNRSQNWTADYTAGVGERREIQLGDGTRVTLNTASAIDVRFDSAQRLVTLRAGEILVHTAPDTQSTPRAFGVATPDGLLLPVGTQFNVRLEEGRTHLAVLQGAVAIEPKAANASVRKVIAAGTQTSFTRHAIAEAVPADEAAVAWTTGMFIADAMPLGDFAREVARYRTGIVRCEPAVAQILVSGAFPIADTNRTLTMLAATYPVEVRTTTPYWVMLSARQAD